MIFVSFSAWLRNVLMPCSLKTSVLLTRFCWEIRNSSISVINFLFMTHSKRWGALPFDFSDIIQWLARLGKPSQFVRDVIRVQRTHFPSLVVDGKTLWLML